MNPRSTPGSPVSRADHLTRRALARVGTGRGAAALAAAAAAMAACGPAGNTGQSGSGATLNAVKLQWMYGPPANTSRVRATLEATAARLPEVFPGPTVETVHVTEAYYDKLLATLAAGTPPDLFWMQVRDLPAYVLRGDVALLEPLVKRDRYDLKDFLEPLVQQYRWGDGQLRGLPWDYGFQALFYNVTLFRQVGLPLPPSDWDSKGWTFDDFRVAAERLTRHQGAAGAAPPDVYGLVNPTRDWFPWVYANGGRLISADNSACLLGKPEAIQAFQLIRDLMHKYYTSPVPAEFRNTNPVPTFVAGRSAMLVHAIATASTELRAITNFEWDAAPMPLGPGTAGRGRGTHGGGSGWVLAKASRSPEEAWALMKHITSRETVTELAKAGWSPPRVSVLDSKLRLDPAAPPKAKAVLRDGYKAIVTNPQILTWNEFNAAAGKMVTDLSEDKITAREAGETITRVTQPFFDEHARTVKAGLLTR